MKYFGFKDNKDSNSQNLLIKLSQTPNIPFKNISKLIELGADPYKPDEKGISAFEYLFNNDNLECIAQLNNNKLLSTLQLLKASRENSLDLTSTKILLEKGADPHKTDIDGISAFQYANKGKHFDLINEMNKASSNEQSQFIVQAQASIELLEEVQKPSPDNNKIQSFLNAGADPYQETNNKSIFQEACKNKKIDLQLLYQMYNKLPENAEDERGKYSASLTQLTIEKLGQEASNDNFKTFNEISKLAVKNHIPGIKEYAEEVISNKAQKLFNEDRNQFMQEYYNKHNNVIAYEEIQDYLGSNKAESLRQAQNIIIADESQLAAFIKNNRSKIYSQYGKVLPEEVSGKFNLTYEQAVEKGITFSSEAEEAILKNAFYEQFPNIILKGDLEYLIGTKSLNKLKEDDFKLEVKLLEEIDPLRSNVYKTFHDFLDKKPLLSNNLQENSSTKLVLDFALNNLTKIDAESQKITNDYSALDKIITLIKEQNPEANSPIINEVSNQIIEYSKKNANFNVAINLHERLVNLNGNNLPKDYPLAQLKPKELENLKNFEALTQDSNAIAAGTRNFSKEEMEVLHSNFQQIEKHQSLPFAGNIRALAAQATINYVNTKNNPKEIVESINHLSDMAKKYPVILSYYDNDIVKTPEDLKEHLTYVNSMRILPIGRTANDQELENFHQFLKAEPPLEREGLFDSNTLFDKSLKYMHQKPELMVEMIKLVNKTHGKDGIDYMKEIALKGKTLRPEVEDALEAASTGKTTLKNFNANKDQNQQKLINFERNVKYFQEYLANSSLSDEDKKHQFSALVMEAINSSPPEIKPTIAKSAIDKTSKENVNALNKEALSMIKDHLGDSKSLNPENAAKLVSAELTEFVEQAKLSVPRMQQDEFNKKISHLLESYPQKSAREAIAEKIFNISNNRIEELSNENFNLLLKNFTPSDKFINNNPLFFTKLIETISETAQNSNDFVTKIKFHLTSSAPQILKQVEDNEKDLKLCFDKIKSYQDRKNSFFAKLKLNITKFTSADEYIDRKISSYKTKAKDIVSGKKTLKKESFVKHIISIIKETFSSQEKTKPNSKTLRETLSTREEQSTGNSTHYNERRKSEGLSR